MTWNKPILKQPCDAELLPTIYQERLAIRTMFLLSHLSGIYISVAMSGVKAPVISLGTQQAMTIAASSCLDYLLYYQSTFCRRPRQRWRSWAC